MAIDLLNDDYWDGKIQRLYYHELEAFIWVLTFTFLRYQNGEAVKGSLVESWMTSDYAKCRKEKNDFINVGIGAREMVQDDFINQWDLALKLLRWVGLKRFARWGENDEDCLSETADGVWKAFTSVIRSLIEKESKFEYLDPLLLTM